MLPDLLCPTPREHPLPLIFERTLRLNDGSIFYASSNPNHFPEHSVPQIKISIPIGKTSFQAIWQTGSGQHKQKQVREGHICVLPANLLHEVVLESKQEMIGIDFEPAFIEQIADELTGKNVEIIEQWTAQDPLIQQLGIDLHREFQQSPRILYVESVIQVLATHLVRHYCTSRVVIEEAVSKLSPQKLQQTIDYIHARLEQDITLSELADIVQMSQYRFARAFKTNITRLKVGDVVRRSFLISSQLSHSIPVTSTQTLALLQLHRKIKLVGFALIATVIDFRLNPVAGIATVVPFPRFPPRSTPDYWGCAHDSTQHRQILLTLVSQNPLLLLW